MSGLQWFRLYGRMVDDEKLRLLAFEDRWHFVALCCLKSSGLLDEENTTLRSRKIAVKLGVQVRELEEICRRLQEVDLIDSNMNPVNWDKLQYRSDSSAERVKKHREKQRTGSEKRGCNVTVTPPDTEAESDTETEADNSSVPTKQKKRVKPAPRPDDVSEQTWNDFEIHRRDKGGPITATGLAAFRREADRVGWTLEQAIIESILRGWRGFKADWIENGKQAIRTSGGASGDRRSSLARACDEALQHLG